MAWDSDLRRVVERSWKIGEVFTLDQVYTFAPELEGLHPNNQHVKGKLRQVLQHLRDDGSIEFVDDDGTYKRLR
jgi:RNA polymerase primary sigma factor